MPEPAPPPGFTVDETPPPGFTVDATDQAPASAEQPDQSVPGFTDEQKQQIEAYIPKAKDAADLERYSLELSGGKSKIGNAQAVIDKRDQGYQTFGWTPATIDKSMGVNVNNQGTMEGLRQSIGEGIIDAIDSFLPGTGDLIRNNRQTGKAFTEHAANAIVADYGPEVGGVIDTILRGGPLDNNVAHERAIMEGDSADHPVASAAGELSGIGIDAMLGNEAGLSDLGRVGKTAVQAAEGAAYGSGAAGPGNRVIGAEAGAVAAPVLGLAGEGVVAGARAAKSVLQGSPGLARRIIAKAISADENTPASVAGQIASANSNDVPMTIADTGENTRGLLAAASRTSGNARTIARDALTDRQAGLADRVTQHIERDLGPVANPHEVADTLMTTARNEAAPLYEAAYARPGADAFGKKVAPLLARPSMKKALANAYRIAAEEGRDPTTLGFDVNEARDVTLTKVPSWQTLDYVKRGMDDVIEGYRDTTTGKLNLDTEGRAINNTQRAFLTAFDQANPDYAAARAAYAGPVKGIAAMNTGRKFLSQSADDIEARMRDMSPFEKQMAALGARRAMAELVASKGDTADVVNALVGTGKKRAMLARLFGDRRQFQRFVNTLGQEREGFRTFKQSLLGSPTAPNLQDDATLNLATHAADAVLTGLSPIQAVRVALKFGVGKIGDKAKQEVAALLSNTDPARFHELALQLREEAIRRGLLNRQVGIVTGGIGNAGAAAIPRQQSQ